MFLSAFLSVCLCFTTAAAFVTLHQQQGSCSVKSIAVAAASCKDDFTDSTTPEALGMMSRRETLLALILGSAIVPPAFAAVTDETDLYANTRADSSYRGLGADIQSPSVMSTAKQSSAASSDELVVSVPKSDISKGGLGIELGQLEFRTNVRVFVKSVLPNSVAEMTGIRKDLIVVSVDGESAERTNADGVAQMVSTSIKNNQNPNLELRFRDPAVFQKRLADLEGSGAVTTQVAPAGDTTQRNVDGSVKFGERIKSQDDQRLTVQQLVPPKLCARRATTDDLLEISYLGTVVETGAVFDGSAIKINGEAIPGRGNDVSLFFVLGKQPFGQFPPGWDVGLEGICVGERRRLIIPPVLAFGSTGLPRRGIPPNATLQYDITLVSLNGLATPQ